MENLVGINNNVLFKWRLLRNDGSPFSPELYSCRLTLLMGRGRTDIKTFSLTGKDKNIVSWELDFKQLRFLGNCSLSLVVMRRGILIAQVEFRDAFRVVSESRRRCDCVQTIELTSFVNIIHDVEDNNKSVTVLFPTFYVDNEMNLHMKGVSEDQRDKFALTKDGYLVFRP